MFSRKRNALVGALCALVGVGALGTSAASADVQTLGLGGWQVQSTAKTDAAGPDVSSPTFDTGSWMPVTPDDGHAPGTEIAVLLQNGDCPNVFYSDNMRKCWGAGDKGALPPNPKFRAPWWYRTTFDANLAPGQSAQLLTNGIVGTADIWVNGQKVASQANVQGAFTRYTFDVTNKLVPGKNSVALLVYPNNPTTQFTTDFVDWAQVPPDNNTGIQFPIQLHTSNVLRLDDAHTTQVNADDLSSSRITVKGQVTNTSATDASGTVVATIDPPKGSTAAPITVSKAVTVPAQSTKTVTFTPSDYPALVIDHPQVWWPYQMGPSPLYTLSEHVEQGGTTSDTADPVTFGVRTIASYLTKASTKMTYGARQFTINGKPFVFRAGGWAEDLFLRYDDKKADDEIELIHNLGLNGVRTEGKEMPDDWYEKMDRAGILIYSGFTCCNKWQNYATSNVLTQTERNVVYTSAFRMGQRLRNHPSVFTISWSDNQPGADQENQTLTGFANADWDIPVQAAAEGKATNRLGPSGMKEGPYNWVTPNYWWDRDHTGTSSDPLNNGGAWGFETEASPGHTIPTQDSLNRFMSPSEQDTLWQSLTANQFHNNDEGGVGGYQFGAAYYMGTAMAARYGQWLDLNGYLKRAHAINYETQRSEFEAYLANSNQSDTPSTGIVYWMLNKPWPSMLWYLYNYDLDQAGSYFGAKKANVPLHAIYSLSDHKVIVDNLTGKAQGDLSVQSRVIGVDGTVLDDQTANGLALPSQGVAGNVITPSIPAATAPPAAASTYFVELTLRQHGQVVDRNVYWQSTQDDIVNWASQPGSDYGRITRFADLTGLNGLGTATVAANASTAKLATPDADGNDRVTTVTITNTSSTPVAGFRLRADVRKGNADGTERAGDNTVLPVAWSENEITLWPGQSQTLTAAYEASNLGDATPVVSVVGWNADKQDVAAPVAGTAPPASASADVPGAIPPVTSAAGIVPARTNTPTALAAAAKRVAVVKVRSSLRGRTAVATVTCTGAKGATCKGKATFTVRVPKQTRGKKHVARTVTIGTRTFSVPAGKQTRLSLQASRSRLASVAGVQLGVKVS